MSKVNLKHADLHKQVYSKMLDDLDNAIIVKIMEDPSCDEAKLLNLRVDAEIKRQLEEEETVTC